MTLHARFRLKRSDFELNTELALPDRGVIALFGPSGSGKTSVLRCVAGLEQATEAYLEVDGEVWQDSAKGIFMAPHRRAIGYVFQEASLFPHLNVQQNLEYGWRRVAHSERRIAQAHAVELLGIAHLLERYPAGLSGGERQRIAIARALLTSPRLLLMDEPLAALDAARKREILPYLERLHAELEMPVLYVSHAIDEVARLADHLVLMEEGRVLAAGPLAETLARADLPTARDEEGGVVIAATVGAQDTVYHLTRLDFPGGSIYVSQRDTAIGQTARLRILARDVSVALTPQEDGSILNRLPAVISCFSESDNRSQVLLCLDAGGTHLLARITWRSFDQLGLKDGMPVWAQIKSVALLD